MFQVDFRMILEQGGPILTFSFLHPMGVDAKRAGVDHLFHTFVEKKNDTNYKKIQFVFNLKIWISGTLRGQQTKRNWQQWHNFKAAR